MNIKSVYSLSIGLVTREPENKTSKRLIEEIKRSSHRLILLTPDNLDLAQEADGLIVCGSPSDAQQIYTLLTSLDAKKVFATSTAKGWKYSRDRQKTFDLLTQNNLPTPYTTCKVDEYLKKHNPPVVIKLSASNRGKGVCIAESTRSATSMCDMLDSLKAPYVLQEYIESPSATDERYFVVGDRVVATMKRTGPAGDFRSNLSLGGVGTSIDSDPVKASLALASAKSFGLGIAGIDIIDSPEGPMILELNPSPGLSIEQATGTNIASTIIEWVEEQVLALQKQ